MAPRPKKKLAPVKSVEAVEPDRAADTVSFDNTFTAKDQYDHLAAAIKNWPLDIDPDLVPIEPVPSIPENPVPPIDAGQGNSWLVWLRANALKKTTLLKSALALLAAIILGWMPLQRLLADTSAEAVINAHVIVVRTPIEGNVSADAANLEIGKEVRAGDELLRIKNPRSDHSSLDNLDRIRAQLTTTIAVLKAKKNVLEKHLSELSVQKERYRFSRIEQLEKRISETDAAVVSAKAQRDVAARALTRARELFSKGTVPEAFVERAVRDDSVATEAINGLLERRKATQIELAAAQKGTFISDGYNDTSESAQRSLDVELQLADVDAHLMGAVDELAAVNRDIVKETKRQLELSTAAIQSTVSGRVWEVMTTPGEHVTAGQELLRLLDCSSLIVTASVSEGTFQRLKIGQHATFKPSDGAPQVKGWITGLTGLAAVASNDAILPKALSGAPYHVTLKFPELDRKANCQISRSGLVTFDTSSPALTANAN
jgi:multidrug resistance efflux pump